jgi:hypothetical protein
VCVVVLSADLCKLDSIAATNGATREDVAAQLLRRAIKDYP